MVDEHRRVARRAGLVHGVEEYAINRALSEMEDMLHSAGKDLRMFGVPGPTRRPLDLAVERELSANDAQQQALIRDRQVPMPNREQKVAFDVILGAVNEKDEAVRKLFFIDGVGGAGKTFLYSTILSAVCAEGKIAMAVVSSGIAAFLLEGGLTAHSRFKIIIADLHDRFFRFASRGSECAELIKDACFYDCP